MRTPSLLASIFLLAGTSVASAALIPPGFLNTVVALGTMTSQPTLPGQPPQRQWVTIGTGFFYGVIAEDAEQPKERKYQVFLVTAGHVVAEFSTQHPQTALSVRMNPDKPGLPANEFDLDPKGWFLNTRPSIDIAVIPVDLTAVNALGIHPVFFADDMFTADRSKMKDIGVSEGDGVFVLGFPMNLAGKQRNYVVVRRGSIARIGEMLDGVSPTFLLDTFVFPGNSGSPVILQPDINAIQGTKIQNAAYLVGMVLSYQSYNDVAFSKQTGQARIVFSENSGLAEVLPVDDIEDTVNQWRFSRTGSPPTPP